MRRYIGLRAATACPDLDLDEAALSSIAFSYRSISTTYQSGFSIAA
jgi:hypothetical protein